MSADDACVRKGTERAVVAGAMLKTQSENGKCKHCDDAVNAVVAVSWKNESGLPSAALSDATAGGPLSFV